MIHEEPFDGAEQIGIVHDVHGGDSIINSQRRNRNMLGIYEIPSGDASWDKPAVAKNPNKKADAQRRALDIAKRLGQLRPEKVSERQWCIMAGVSPSFFSNLRGTPTKPPSEPTVGNLRDLLRIVGLSLPEFFVDESDGRLLRAPNIQDLAKLVGDALRDAPRSPDRRAVYLSEYVLDSLRLPLAKPSNQTSEDDSAEVAPEAVPSPRAATS